MSSAFGSTSGCALQQQLDEERRVINCDASYDKTLAGTHVNRIK
jgi:hypothetical protein